MTKLKKKNTHVFFFKSFKIHIRQFWWFLTRSTNASYRLEEDFCTHTHSQINRSMQYHIPLKWIDSNEIKSDFHFHSIFILNMQPFALAFALILWSPDGVNRKFSIAYGICHNWSDVESTLIKLWLLIYQKYESIQYIRKS